MTKTRQIDQIKALLLKEGYVGRNYCIDNRITVRLGAVIHLLRKEGWKISGKKTQRDFLYLLDNRPKVPEIKIVEKVDRSGKLTRVAQYV